MTMYTLELNQLIADPDFDLFSFSYPFYSDDESLQIGFENKFKMAYYHHQIGCETVHRFKTMLRHKLCVIMPYYEKLYETELRSKGMDFLVNKDLREEFTKEITTIDNTTGLTTTNTTSLMNGGSKNISNNNAKLSNVADGVASPSLTDGKLTSVGKDNSDSETNTNSVSNGTINNNTSANSNGSTSENNVFTSKGNIGVVSQAKLLEDWRAIILDIDVMIIKECRDLFMKIY